MNTDIRAHLAPDAPRTACAGRNCTSDGTGEHSTECKQDHWIAVNSGRIIELAVKHGVASIDRRGHVVSGYPEGSDMRDDLLGFARALLEFSAAPKQRESAATLAALADVDAGAQVAPTARKHGIQPSTLFRALARRRAAAAKPPAG